MKDLEPKKRQFSPGEAQILLKEEILHLEKQLEDQIAVRCALEKAMSNNQPIPNDSAYIVPSQPAEDLIKEIALLELEVVYLEKYLLSLYRKSFGKRLSSTLPTRTKTDSQDHKWPFSKVAKPLEESSPFTDRSTIIQDRDTSENSTRKHDEITEKGLVDSGIYRSHSSLSHSSFRSDPMFRPVADALDSYHSLPLSMLEQRAQDSISSASLAEHLGPNFRDCNTETANWLSEEMIKSISAIYCQISDPPLYNHGFFSSPILYSSPASKFSPGQDEDDMWTNNFSYVEASKEFSGPFSGMVEVNGIHRDSQRLNAVEDQLQHFRSLISRLAQADPGKLKHEERLAFWINVHNALVMHAFLAYGIPRGNLKRISQILKAAYNIGGQTISVDTIQSSILGCRLPRPAQWLQSLLFPKAKLKARDSRKAYSIEHSEPRLHFALCSGCQSDPSVRLYTTKNVFQELEMAKEEYIQSNIGLNKEQKLLLPKNVEYYAKEMELCPAGITELIAHLMPDSLRQQVKIPQQSRLWKKIDWIPHNFSFGFRLSSELIR